MTKKLMVKIGVCAVAVGIAACSSGSTDRAQATGARQTVGGGAHIMKKFGAAQSTAKTGTPLTKLTYHGGPVISNIKVVDVFWGSGATSFQSQLEGFYSAITASPYFDWLSEYNTPTASIGEGTFVTSVVDPSPPAGTTIDDTQISAEVANLIANGTVPPNDGNTLYMVYFPPNVTITLQGSASCQVFCAYHGTGTNNNGDFYYGVLPDLGSNGCQSGCGNNANVFDNLTEVSSHEMIEATTDSAVGINTLSWYDDTDNEEIGDLCVGQSASVAGYTIQLEWSNSQGGCIATNSSVPPPPDAGPPPPPPDAGPPPPPPDAGGGSCSHAICSTGGALTPDCDPCAGQVCGQDPYCCSTQWDSICVGEVGSICGQTCP
jgi:hypothetical protein